MAGSWNQSGAFMSPRTTPSISHSPAMIRSASARMAALAASGTAERGVRREYRGEPAFPRQGRRRQRGHLARPHLPARPGPAERLLPDTPGHLAWRHPADPADIPGKLRGRGLGHYTASGLPLARLSPTAIVALVVASSESTLIGIGPPVRTASTNCSISARWPLS